MEPVDEDHLDVVVARLPREGVHEPLEPRVAAVGDVDDADLGHRRTYFARLPAIRLAICMAPRRPAFINVTVPPAPKVALCVDLESPDPLGAQLRERPTLDDPLHG